MLKTSLSLLGALGLFCIIPVRAAEPLDLDRTLKGVEDRYNKIQTLEVKFTESITQRGNTHKESGTLYLRKKGKMRWEYSSGQLFISDGKFIDAIIVYNEENGKIQN